MRNTAPALITDPQAYGLPWQGTMDLPPGGVNHAYKIITRGSGKMGLAKNASYVKWVDQQATILAAQGCPRLPAMFPLAVYLTITFRDLRPDIDSVLKGTLDTLQKVIGHDDGSLPAVPRKEKGVIKLRRPSMWNDRYIFYLSVTKCIDKESCGIAVILKTWTPL